MKKAFAILVLLITVLFAYELHWSKLQGIWTATSSYPDGMTGKLNHTIEIKLDSFFLAFEGVTSIDETYAGSAFTNYVMGEVKVIDKNSFILKGTFVDSTYSYKLKKEHDVHYKRKKGKVKITCHLNDDRNAFYVHQADIKVDKETGKQKSYVFTLGPFSRDIDL